MPDHPRNRRFVGLMALATAATLGSPSFGQEPKSDDRPSLEYWADASLYSFHPKEELATYHSHNGGGVGPNGTLSFGVVYKHHDFEATMIAKRKGQRFLVNVTVKPGEQETRARAQEIDYDLSDLNPRSLDIARDDDGRVYRLMLIPRIKEEPKPREFEASDLKLEYWTFHGSPVVLNDQDYVGRLSMSIGPIASCDVPGLAKIEFSLLHLRAGLPAGTLEDGVINIAHGGTTLRISDVKNGANAEVLAGGPYRVWVRWNKPTQTVEEYRQSLKEHIASLRARVESGDLSLSPGTLERLEEMSESDRIGQIGGGVRGVEDDDLATPGE